VVGPAGAIANRPGGGDSSVAEGLTWDGTQDLVRRCVDGGRHGLSWQRSEAPARPGDGLGKLALNMALCSWLCCHRATILASPSTAAAAAVSAEGTVGDLTAMRAACDLPDQLPTDLSPRDIQPYLTALFAAGLARYLLAQLADKDINDLEVGLVHAAIEVIEELVLGNGLAVMQGKQLQHAELLAGQLDRLAIDFVPEGRAWTDLPLRKSTPWRAPQGRNHG